MLFLARLARLGANAGVLVTPNRRHRGWRREPAKTFFLEGHALGSFVASLDQPGNVKESRWRPSPRNREDQRGASGHGLIGPSSSVAESILFGLPRCQSPISNCIRGSNYCQQVLPIRLREHGCTGLLMPRQRVALIMPRLGWPTDGQIEFWVLYHPLGEREGRENGQSTSLRPTAAT